MAGYDLSNLSVVVAEDNAFLRQILVRMLRGLGVGDIRQTADGERALQLLETFPADIAFVDWVMAPIDGIEFLRRIRHEKGSPNPYLPVVMVTGYTDLHRVCEARDGGVTEFLVKPFSVNSLAKRLSTIIENPRPFLRTADYFGPDRRTHDDPNYGGPDRRAPERVELDSEVA
jgi:two-component system chemotaxis response regulator CheY